MTEHEQVLHNIGNRLMTIAENIYEPQDSGFVNAVGKALTEIAKHHFNRIYIEWLVIELESEIDAAADAEREGDSDD